MQVEVRKLAIGISSFRSDEAVIALVRSILEQQVPFDWLFVVDSQAGNLGQRLGALAHPRILYYGEPENIGSAGNLCRRLAIAADLGVDCMLAFNHDAPVSARALDELLRVATETDGWGVIYPLRFEQGRDQYDVSGTRWFPFGFRGVHEKPSASLTPVHWGSSNGALYSLAPVHVGLMPHAELWMGWEDYQYGIALEHAGWSQWLVPAAEIRDNYEFRKRTLGGVEIAIADKPCWYYYYAVRNLLLVHLHIQPSLRGIASLSVWLPVYALRILAFPGRCSRREAVVNFFQGLYDGIVGRKGKWHLP